MRVPRRAEQLGAAWARFYDVRQVDVMPLGCPSCQSTSFLLSHRTGGSDGSGLVSRAASTSRS